MILPQKFKERMRNMLGADYESFVSALDNAPIYSALRVNTLKKDVRNTIKDQFDLTEQIDWCTDGFYVQKGKFSGNHPYHIGGLFYFQEPSAMSTVEAIPIDEGDFVLDLCAAPGGKATQAAAKLNGTGLLVANEIVKKRATILSGNIERMGIKNAIVTNETPQNLADKYPLFFDKIIVDAPCSGEGMFRKEPQAVEEWSEEHTQSCGIRQKNILDCAVRMLKDGGMLVYSTCTFAPCENEEIAEYLIKEHSLEILPISNLSMLDKGRNEWTKYNTDVSSSRRIFPQNTKGEGHFVALFKKNGTKAENKTTPKPTMPNPELKKAILSYREFEKNNLSIKLDGHFALFGEMLYVLPYDVDINKIKVLRYGLQLGEFRKNRFEPSHSLALALGADDFKQTENLDLNSPKLHKFLTGNVFESNKKGYSAICVNSYPLGWGKASDGIMKNKLPKGVRILK